jgi:hypothetical protein
MTNYVVSTAVNGTFEVPDDQINTAQLAINLIGRGVTNYGQAVAQNDINLLQNFAGPTPPIQPIIGQLWFNSTTLYLQVYTSAGTWSPVSFSSDLSNYATVGQLASTNAALSNLASISATTLELNNYVTIAGLYTPQINWDNQYWNCWSSIDGKQLWYGINICVTIHKLSIRHHVHKQYRNVDWY